MKFNSNKISINYLLSQNIVIQFLIHSLLFLFFKVIRLGSIIFAYEGSNVLIISLHRLGDTIFTLPAIMEVYKKYGQATTIICWPESVPIYKLVFNESRICEINQDNFFFGRRIAKSDARRKLIKLNPSLIIDITGSMISASLIFNIRAKKIIGTNGNQFKTIYDQFVEFREKPQLSDIYLDAISPLIQVTEQFKISQNNKLLNLKGKILIHPFAGWREKEWNLKKFVTLAIRLNKDFNSSLIIQKGQFSKDVLCEIENSNVEVIQTKSVNQLIECIRESSLFIGNDSGPVNIANFFGKPTFTIYGATNPDYTATHLDHQICLQKTLKCSAKKDEKFCAIGGMIYNCSGIQCMNLLNEEEVYANLLTLLQKYCQRKSGEVVTVEN